MDTASYSQPSAKLCTVSTSAAGVNSLPEGAFRGSTCPVARIFTFVPPISTASIDAGALERLLSVASLPSGDGDFAEGSAAAALPDAAGVSFAAAALVAGAMAVVPVTPI